MASFLSVDDPDFFDHIPPHLRHMQSGRDGGNIAYFLMGKAESNPPTVACLKIPPGGIIGRHTHSCWRFEVVVRGSLDVGERVLKPGDVMISEPHVFYGPHQAGPEGCTTFEIFGDHDGSHAPILDMGNGLKTFDSAVPEQLAQLRDIMNEQNRAWLDARATVQGAKS